VVGGLEAWRVATKPEGRIPRREERDSAYALARIEALLQNMDLKLDALPREPRRSRALRSFLRCRS
jgi:hypothetical protein